MDAIQSLAEAIRSAASAVPVASLVRAGLLLLVGIAIARGVGRLIQSALSQRVGAHEGQLGRRIVTYGITVLFAVAALHQLGFELSVILGAAGVLTVAIGFAAQTAASNLISGAFLLGEGPFEVGETVRIGDVTGEVLAVDLLSIKLRTFDNLLVRIPNETVMKAVVTNLSRFPIRRYDLRLVADAETDLDALEALLLAATEHPTCLEEPRPIVIFLGFNESGIEVQLSAWAMRENFREMRNRLHKEVARAMDDAGIGFAYPRTRVALGSDLRSSQESDDDPA